MAANYLGEFIRSNPVHQLRFDVFDNLHMQRGDSDDTPECTSNVARCRSHICSPSEHILHVSPIGQDEHIRGYQEAVDEPVSPDAGVLEVQVDVSHLCPLSAQRFRPGSSDPSRRSCNFSKVRHKHNRTRLNTYSYNCVSISLPIVGGLTSCDCSHSRVLL